nr:hypothetical protein [Tanacetum cinerariifolium]
QPGVHLAGHVGGQAGIQRKLQSVAAPRLATGPERDAEQGGDQQRPGTVWPLPHRGHGEPGSGALYRYRRQFLGQSAR